MNKKWKIEANFLITVADPKAGLKVCCYFFIFYWPYLGDHKSPIQFPQNSNVNSKAIIFFFFNLFFLLCFLIPLVIREIYDCMEKKFWRYCQFNYSMIFLDSFQRTCLKKFSEKWNTGRVIEKREKKDDEEFCARKDATPWTNNAKDGKNRDKANATSIKTFDYRARQEKQNQRQVSNIDRTDTQQRWEARHYIIFIGGYITCNWHNVRSFLFFFLSLLYTSALIKEKLYISSCPWRIIFW